MTDTVQVKKSLQFCCDELAKYQNLSRSGLTLNEMLLIDRRIIYFKERIDNLRAMLNVC